MDPYNSSCSLTPRNVVYVAIHKDHFMSGHYLAAVSDIIYSLLGPSGSGKTTVFHCIVGLLKLRKGEIRIFGHELGTPDFLIPGRGVGFMPQDFARGTKLSVEETLWYFGKLFHMTKSEIQHRIDFLMDLLKIPDRRSVVEKLSGGQKRRVSLAVALIHKPPLLILDEPTVGVDPLLRQAIWNHLLCLATKEHTTILLSTHYVEEAGNSHMVGLMREGSLLAEMSPTNLLAAYEGRTIEEVFLKLSVSDEKTFNQTKTKEISNNILNKLFGIMNFNRLPFFHMEQSQKETIKNEGTFSHELSERSRLMDDRNKIANPDVYPADMLMFDTKMKLQKFEKSLSRMKTLINKDIVLIKRNFMYFVLQIILPVLQLVLYNCIFAETYDVSMAIVNSNNANRFTSTFLTAFDETEIKQVLYSNLPLALESVRTGKTVGVLHVKPHFTSNLIKKYVLKGSFRNETVQENLIELHLDMTNKQISYIIQIAVKRSFQKFADEMALETNIGLPHIQSSVMVEKPVYGTRNMTFKDFVFPNLIIGTTYITCVCCTTFLLIIEKKTGQIDRLLVGGVKHFEILLSILLFQFSIIVIQVTFTMVYLIWLYSTLNYGSLISIFLDTLATGAVGLSIGLFMATFCENEFVATMLSFFIHVQVTVYCNIISPKEGLPRFLSSVTYALPITYLVDHVRYIMTGREILAQHCAWNMLLTVSAWIVLPILLAIVIFRHRY